MPSSAPTSPLSLPGPVAQLGRRSLASLLERTAPDGFAPTSLTGAYPGMFSRDASVQAMALLAAGEESTARRVLGYLLRAGLATGAGRAPQVVPHLELSADPTYRGRYGATPYSDVVLVDQPDGNFSVVLACARYVLAVPDDEEFAELVLEQCTRYADHHFVPRYWDEQQGLLWNPNLEHSRNLRFWSTHDLLTNVVASEALEAMARAFVDRAPECAARWRRRAREIARGVEEHLVVEVDGRPVYAELIDREDADRLRAGFSWVNLAPVAFDWFAADPALVENTYDAYLAAAGRRWGDHLVLGAYDDVVQASGEDEVIGKGLAWELRLVHRLERADRWQALTSFVVERTPGDLYPESWYPGHVSDAGNQEQLSWFVHAVAAIEPSVLRAGSADGR